MAGEKIIVIGKGGITISVNTRRLEEGDRFKSLLNQAVYEKLKT